MKFLFIIVYTLTYTYPTPCPDPSYAKQGISCLVYQGYSTGTQRREEITSDTSELNRILKENPTAKVDTFILTPYHRF